MPKNVQRQLSVHKWTVCIYFEH